MLQFFSLISDGLGGVFGLTESVNSTSLNCTARHCDLFTGSDKPETICRYCRNSGNCTTNRSLQKLSENLVRLHLVSRDSKLEIILKALELRSVVVCNQNQV